MVKKINQTNREKKIDSPLEEWILISKVVKSGKYASLAKTHKGFKPFIKEGQLKAKTESRGARTKTYLKQSDLDELLSLISTLESNYVTDKEAAKALGFPGVNPLTGSLRRNEILGYLIDFCKSEKIDYKYFSNSFKQAYLYIDKRKFRDFLNTHISLEDAYIKYDINYNESIKLEKTFNMTRKKISRMHHFFILKEAEEFFTPQQQEVYSLSVATEMLGITGDKFDQLRKEEKLTHILLKGKSHFLKEEVDYLIKKIEDIKNKYCTSKDVMKILNKTYIPVKHIPSYPATTLINITLGNYIRTVYLLSEVYKYKNVQDELYLLEQAHQNEPKEAFDKILSIKQIEFTQNSKYTSEKWYSYCYEKLLLTRGGNDTKRALVNNLVQCTGYLSNLTRNKELYSFYSNEINLSFFNDAIIKRNQCLLYGFLIEFEATLKATLDENNTKINTYDVAKLINPYNYEIVEKPKDTYSYEEYIKIYNYVKNNNHKRQAIIDAENIIEGLEDSFHYSSAWLYALVHLSNAWRHSDVISIPKVNLTELGILSLKTLKERDLTSDEANCVINQISRNYFIASKNGATNNFFCAEDLVLPLATAAVICTIIATQTTLEENKTIINFGTKTTKFMYGKSHNAFFRDFTKQEADFKFESLKMNRTVLVLIYMILVKKGKGSAALEMARKLRAHQDFESSNIYLKIPQQELDKLCASLFDRKHFGFIPDLLATVLLGDDNNRDERTKNIIAINKKFGGIHKIEATAGFINKALSERQLVAEMIFSMGLDEVTALMFDLNANLLPSREGNIQCIVAEKGCQKPQYECRSCPYSVPNFYTLSSLAESVKSTIKEFVEEYEADSFPAEKTRLMNFLYIEMDNFERAIQMFGKEEVFKFFEGGEDEYNNLLELLDIEDADEFEKYLTYNPLFLS
ncbi:hypothetical protein [Priestia aryabhattai]